MKTYRDYSRTDQLCFQIDSFVRTVFGKPTTTLRDYPAAALQEPKLSDEEKNHAAGLMRVNHTGEVCAQALYQGQFLTAKSSMVAEQMCQAAKEENDHLVWCDKRLQELDSHTSYLNLFFYLHSFLMGTIAGFCGDRYSLGFLAETEKQVGQHLTEHFDKLPAEDYKSRLIIQQMQIDEAKHEALAHQQGAAILPSFVCKFMTLMSKVMVKTTYYL
jgi:ubiquinone biosynthesis monooxygenase Coq7